MPGSSGVECRLCGTSVPKGRLVAHFSKCSRETQTAWSNALHMSVKARGGAHWLELLLPKKHGSLPLMVSCAISGSSAVAT